MQALTIAHLTAHSPRGNEFVATARPPLSWRVETTVAPWSQERAELELHRGTRVETAEVGVDSVRVPWPFESLSAGEDVSLRVRVSGSGDTVSDWSEPLRIRAGFLEPGGWAAAPIGLAEPSEEAQPGLARTEFTTDGEVRQALLYATALGGYQVSINGADVDDQVLKPGWTSYTYRTVHDTTDVSGQLRLGRNAIGVRFAGAWATERFGFRTSARRVDAHPPPGAGRGRGLVRTRLRRLGLATGRVASRHRHAAGPGGAAGPPVRAPTRTGGDHLAVRPDAARLRSEPRGPATARGGRPSRNRDHAPARRGAGARRARHPTTSGRRGNRPLHIARRFAGG